MEIKNSPISHIVDSEQNLHPNIKDEVHFYYILDGKKCKNCAESFYELQIQNTRK